MTAASSTGAHRGYPAGRERPTLAPMREEHAILTVRPLQLTRLDAPPLFLATGERSDILDRAQRWAREADLPSAVESVIRLGDLPRAPGVGILDRQAALMLTLEEV